MNLAWFSGTACSWPKWWKKIGYIHDVARNSSKMFPSTLWEIRWRARGRRNQRCYQPIQSIERFAMSTSGPLPFKKPTSHILVRVEPTNDQWGDPHTELPEWILSQASCTIGSTSSDHDYPNLIDYFLHHSYGTWLGWELIRAGSPSQISCWHHTHPDVWMMTPPFDITINPVKSEADGYFHTLAVWQEARSHKVAITFLISTWFLIHQLQKPLTLFISPRTSLSSFRSWCLRHSLNLKGITELTDELPFEAKKRICIVFVYLNMQQCWNHYKVKGSWHQLGYWMQCGGVPSVCIHASSWRLMEDFVFACVYYYCMLGAQKHKSQRSSFIFLNFWAVEL